MQYFRLKKEKITLMFFKHVLSPHLKLSYECCAQFCRMATAGCNLIVKCKNFLENFLLRVILFSSRQDQIPQTQLFPQEGKRKQDISSCTIQLSKQCCVFIVILDPVPLHVPVFNLCFLHPLRAGIKGKFSVSVRFSNIVTLLMARAGHVFILQSCGGLIVGF